MMLLGQLADAAEDQVRLYRRSTRRIDNNGNRRGLPDRESTLKRAGKTGKRKPRAQWGGKANNAG
jgi:hypothetical protein